jgi:hypothetical protein
MELENNTAFIEPEKPYVLAIDPGYTNMGLVLAEVDGAKLIVRNEWSEKAASWQKCSTVELVSEVWSWFDGKLQPYLRFIQKVYFEDQYFQPFGHGGFIGMKLKTLQTAIVSYFLKNNISIMALPSSAVKRQFKLTQKNRVQNKKALLSYLKEEFDFSPRTDHTGDCVLLFCYVFKPVEIILKN